MHAIREFFSSLANNYVAHSPVWRVLVAVLGVLLFLIAGQHIGESLFTDPVYPDQGNIDLNVHSDLDLYVRAAENLSSNPYRAELGSESGFDRYGYPPLLADVIAGLKALLGPALLGAVWPALCVASLVGAIVLLARGFGARLGYHWIALAAGVALMGRVIRSDIMHGQVNVMVLLLLAAGLALRSQNRVVAASLAFAVMMSLKPFMGAVMIYFALRGDWRMVRWGVGMGAAVLAASFLPTWPNTIEAALGWREAMQHFVTPPFVTKPDNQSVYGLLVRVFTETPYSTPWINSPNLVPVFMTLAVFLAAVLAVVGLHLGKREDWDEDRDGEAGAGPAPAVLLLECSLVIALAAFCGPLTEGNHMILAFAGLAGALSVGAARIREKSRHSRLWMITIAAWLLPTLFVVFPKSLWFAYGIESTWQGLSGHGLVGWEILLSGRCAITLLLAGAATALTLWRERKTAADAVIPKRPFGRRRSPVQLASGAAPLR